jgi:nitroreductase
MSVIFQRRSVRSFLPKPIEQDKLERVLRAGFEAPSAHNRRPWEFIVATSRKDREDIAAMSPYAKMLAQAAAAIAVCVNLECGRVDMPQDTWWIQDLSAATENILLQAVQEGLGGVWLGWYPDEGRVSAFAARFGLPPHILPFSVVALGYPAKTPEPAFRFDADRVYYGAYGKKDKGDPEFKTI